jgi:hypothetical protein
MTKVAEIVLRYTTIGQEIAAHEVTMPVTVNLVSTDEAAAAEVDREVTEEVVVLLSARAQEQASQHAERGEFDAAQKLLGDTAAELRKMARSSKAPEELVAQADQLEEGIGWMSGATYSAASRKAMLYRSRSSRQRRKRPEQ